MSSSSSKMLPFNNAVPFMATQIKVRKQLLDRYEDMLQKENRYVPPSKILYKPKNSYEIYEYNYDGTNHQYPSVDLSKEYDNDLIISPDTTVSSTPSSCKNSVPSIEETTVSYPSRSSTIPTDSDGNNTDIPVPLPPVPATTAVQTMIIRKSDTPLYELLKIHDDIHLTNSTYPFGKKETSSIPTSLPSKGSMNKNSLSSSTKSHSTIISTNFNRNGKSAVTNHYETSSSITPSLPLPPPLTTDNSSSPQLSSTKDIVPSSSTVESAADIYPSSVMTSSDKLNILLDPLITKLHRAIQTASLSTTPPPPPSLSISSSSVPVSTDPSNPLFLSGPTVVSPRTSNVHFSSDSVPNVSTLFRPKPTSSLPPATVGTSSSKSESVQVLEALTTLVQSLQISKSNSHPISLSIDTTQGENKPALYRNESTPSRIPLTEPISSPRTTGFPCSSSSTLSSVMETTVVKLSTPPRSILSHSKFSRNSTPYIGKVQKNIHTNSLIHVPSSILAEAIPESETPELPTVSMLGPVSLRSSKYLHTFRNVEKSTDLIVSPDKGRLSTPTISIPSIPPPTVPVGDEFTKLSHAYKQLELLRNQLHRMKNST